MEEISVYDVSSRKDSVYDKIQEELSKYFKIKFNEIALEYEIFDANSACKIDFNESSLLIHLHREKLNVSPQVFKTYLKSHFVERINPLIEYFKSLPPWNGKDHVKRYAGYVNTDDNELFRLHLLKWAVRAVKTVFLKEAINKHVLVLEGGQSFGKSYFLNFLCPTQLEKYLYTHLGIGRDERIKLAKSLIINIEELDVMGKYDINAIKALISQVSINERLPYADKSTLLYRTCSFLASTNRAEFLCDDTGSVRWIIFSVIEKIDFSYSKEFNIDDFWSQAYHIFKYQKDFKSDLTQEEIKVNELRNERFTIQSVENEFVLKYYSTSDNLSDFRTPSEIVTELQVMGHKLIAQKVGSALKKHNFTRIKHAKRQVYGYLAKPKFRDSPWGFTDS
ncbi:virulence-associated E family protein [Flavobacterium sp. ZT3R18]|uniref:VapE domain-containing protein n=1 Tax=Flavobacterium sp. ZT3R18 TaxID=2594429 RepID=UPI00117B6F70|nr:VapE domain-containing protein [Flavobacterium sp. ZT3R18]TRX38127.1 virulence-associated E family protein [Flavobacterium sp. ZT3R18]